MENDENSINSIFKALVRETSVYKYYVELKENVITEQGFLDLIRTPDLFISGAGQFIRNLRIKNDLRHEDMAKLLDVNRSNVFNWESNHRNIALQSLIKLAETLGVSKETIYSLIDQGKFSIRDVALQVKLEKIRDIINHLSPHKYGANWRITVINYSKEILTKIKFKLNITPLPHISGKVINSKALHNYLTTFFRYTKVPKIRPPLTREVENWFNNGVNLKHAIICPCLQSDGSASCGEITYHGNDRNLHDYFVDAMYYEYNELPSTYFKLYDSSDCYVTGYKKQTTKKIIDEIKGLGGNTKTSPAVGQSVKEYFKEPQPHLEYLINAPEIEQKIALRVLISAEGSITIHRREGRVYPSLGLACTNPDLATQIRKITQRFDMNFFKIYSRRSWSGIKGLSANSIRICINYLKLGGFIKGVKISANSKYHKDIEKDILILGILEFKLRQNTNQELKKLSCKEVHYKVNEIINNREYNTVDYYIEYFS